jgi:oligogalacturonide lyase
MSYYILRLLFAVLLLLMNNFTIASDVGKIWPSEKETWIDSEFGYEITRWTNHDSLSWHVYFNIESFIDETHAIVFSQRSGHTNLYKLNLESGEMIQMTDESDLDGHIWHWPEHQTIWYAVGNTIKALDTQSYKNRTICTTESAPRSFTVTCDAKWIVVSLDQSKKKRDEGLVQPLGPYVIYKMSTDTGERIQSSPDYGFVIGHLQASPTDPKRISYCWQHLYRPGNYPGIRGKTPIRIWWISIDSTDGGPVGPQEFGIHRTHEFWFPDGERIGYSARYKYGPNLGKQYLGSCKPDGSDNYMIEAPVLFAHTQMFKDLKHWVVDVYDGMVLTMMTIEDRKIVETQSLFRHDSSWQGQASHPHPHFSPNGRYVLFSTDKTGSAQVYTVRIDLDKM